MKKFLKISVTGRVQGVWFRKSAFEQANALGLHGFVRNEPDGSVHIEAEGEAETLDTFVAWCGHGPTGARVEKVVVEAGELRHFEAFKIQYS